MSLLRLASSINTERHAVLHFDTSAWVEDTFRFLAMTTRVSHGISDFGMLGVVRIRESDHLGVGNFLFLRNLVWCAIDNDGNCFIFVFVCHIGMLLKVINLSLIVIVIHCLSMKSSK